MNSFQLPPTYKIVLLCSRLSFVYSRRLLLATRVIGIQDTYYSQLKAMLLSVYYLQFITMRAKSSQSLDKCNFHYRKVFCYKFHNYTNPVVRTAKIKGKSAN